jgi:hypothetical protein
MILFEVQLLKLPKSAVHSEARYVFFKALILSDIKYTLLLYVGFGDSNWNLGNSQSK